MNFSIKKLLAWPLVFIAACHPKMARENAAALKKIGFDISKINDDGLSGPTGGQTSVAYEFCIPADEKLLKEVRSIDPLVEKSGGRGRVGCSPNQWLCLSATHQKDWKKKLLGLARLPYVKRIEQVFYE